MKMIISAMNMNLRPKTSARPPSAKAPIRMPSRLAALTMPCSHRRDREFLGDQGQCDAGREDDHAFKEFAGGGEHPDAPLHGGERGARDRRAVRPGGCLVDIVLDALV